MAIWRSLPQLGAMVEILDGTTNPWCKAMGHSWAWQSDAVSCTRPRCRHVHPRSEEILGTLWGLPFSLEDKR